MQTDDNQQMKAERKEFATTPLNKQEGPGISCFQDMQEHPESYSENELEAMMDILDQEPDLDMAWREFESKHIAGNSKSRLATFNNRIRKAAAVLAGILVLSGIAYAAIRLVRSHQPMAHPEQTEELKDSLRRNPQELQKQCTIEVNSVHTDGNKLGDGKDDTSNPPVRFNDVSLDSIISLVSAHYDKTAIFLNEKSKNMRFIITWNPDEPLTEFIEELNMFDGMIVTVHQDTIFVEATDGKEGAL